MEGEGRSASRSERFDRLTLAGIALGIAILLQPWWQGGFRVGFLVTLAATLAQIVAAHLGRGENE